MAAIYVRLIKAGKMTVAEVPARWREQAAKLMKEA